MEEKIFKGRLISTFLIIVLVALLAVYYFLGTDYLRQSQGHEALTVHINEVTRTLAQTPPPPQDLESRLAAAETSLAAAQSALPRDINSTRVINTILKLADTCQVRAIPLVTKPWTKENIGQGYYVFRLNVAVKGTFSNLSSFVSQLENGELETLVVENLIVTRAIGPVTEATTPVQASVDLAIYSQFTTPE